MTAAETLDNEKTRADQAEAKVKATETERDTEKTRADQAEASLKTAKEEAATAKAAETNMREQLAARGIKPNLVKKAASAHEGNGTGAAATVADLREQLSACTDPAEKFTLSQKIRELENPAKR